MNWVQDNFVTITLAVLLVYQTFMLFKLNNRQHKQMILSLNQERMHNLTLMEITENKVYPRQRIVSNSHREPEEDNFWTRRGDKEEAEIEQLRQNERN